MSGGLHSFARFHQRPTDEDGNRLLWGRADEDGAPFRGPTAPFVTREEEERRLVQVKVHRWKIFDLNKPEEGKAYQDLMDALGNGWWRFIYMKRFINKELKHYVEWAEVYIEDAQQRAAQAAVNGAMMQADMQLAPPEGNVEG